MTKVGKNRQGADSEGQQTQQPPSKNCRRVHPCAEQGYHQHNRPSSWPRKADGSSSSSGSCSSRGNRVGSLHNRQPQQQRRQQQQENNSAAAAAGQLLCCCCQNHKWCRCRFLCGLLAADPLLWPELLNGLPLSLSPSNAGQPLVFGLAKCPVWHLEGGPHAHCEKISALKAGHTTDSLEQWQTCHWLAAWGSRTSWTSA